MMVVGDLILNICDSPNVAINVFRKLRTSIRSTNVLRALGPGVLGPGDLGFSDPGREGGT